MPHSMEREGLYLNTSVFKAKTWGGKGCTLCIVGPNVVIRVFNGTVKMSILCELYRLERDSFLFPSPMVWITPHRALLPLQTKFLTFIT